MASNSIFYQVLVVGVFLVFFGACFGMHAMNREATERDNIALGYGPFGYGERYWGGNRPAGKITQKELQERLETIESKTQNLSEEEREQLHDRKAILQNILTRLYNNLNNLQENDDQDERRVILQSIKEHATLLEGMEKIKNLPPAEIERLNTEKEEIRKQIREFRHDNKFGRAIASGLAGADWRALQDEQIQDVWEGAKLGGLMRVSRACSDVLGKRIENSIDRVLGGAWDRFISALIDGCTSAWEVLFHSGEEPFTPKQLRGWQSLIKATFEDIDRLMKDGLKDSLRGHDMTLRKTSSLEEEGGEEPESIITAWQMLISGYIRQFEHVVLQLEKHLVYYNGDQTVVFYATELKERLKETNKLLIQAGSLKDLDNLLDSNKSLILGFKNNILNLFTRLLEIVEQPAAGAGSSSSSTTRDATRRDGMRSGMDDDSGPRPFRGGF